MKGLFDPILRVMVVDSLKFPTLPASVGAATECYITLVQELHGAAHVQ